MESSQIGKGSRFIPESDHPQMYICRQNDLGDRCEF